MTEFEIKHGLSQDEPGPLELAASPVSTVEQGEVVAWMDPATLDVISAERKASWLSDYGIGGKAKAAAYTRTLGDLRPAPAAGDAQIMEFVREVAQQKPEKPDHWSSCGQCQANTRQAEELLEAIAAQRQGDA